MPEKEKLVLISKVWKFGESLALGIPRSQNPLFEPLRGKKLKIIIEVIE